MERMFLEGRGTSGIPQYILNLFYLDFSGFHFVRWRAR
ncbi:hypothetical protein SynRS9915_00746 [Synechococcus sp. RS9915]|nr:hypothetical protein SynRS9915_00746 [Synechococcus sp. RS9915]